MVILPAIDLRGGAVVRLIQGDYGKMTVYGTDPAATARDFKSAGAEYMHVVDLDGAKDGEPKNFGVISDLIAHSGLRVEVGGGIRTEERIRRYLDAGAARVILGTAAVRNFDFTAQMVKKYGVRIAVGVDARGGMVAVEGWTETSAVDAFLLCEKLAAIGVRTIIYTDIACDGVSGGTNLPAYGRLKTLDTDIIASGGITTANDLDALRDIGVYGAIIGKALYTGALELKTVIKRYGGENDGL